MSSEEKNLLKGEYNILKRSYAIYKREATKVPKDSLELYEIKQELTALGLRISQIRQAFFDDTFGRFYISTLLENFIFGEKRESLGGR